MKPGSVLSAVARVAATVAVMVAVATVGVIAGQWQFHKHQLKSAAVAAFEAASSEPVVDIDAALAVATPDPASLEWRAVTVTGVIDSDSATWLRGRTADGVASLQLLSWVDTADGHSVLVNLGWVPRSGATELAPPSGTITITGIARQFEADDERRGEGATRINPAQLPPAALDQAPVWVLADSVTPVVGCDTDCPTVLQPVPLPSLSLGPHLSYAFQWWILAVAGPIAIVWLVRRDGSLAREQGQGSAKTARQTKPANSASASRRRPPSDEDVEDAL